VFQRKLARALRDVEAKLRQHREIRYQKSAHLAHVTTLEREQTVESRRIESVNGQPVIGFRRVCHDLSA
jgi:hypothetical protein